MRHQSDCPGNRLSNNGRRPRLLILLAVAATLGALVLGVTLADASAPVVTVEDASSVGYTTAQVEGTVDPGGESTTYRFQYVTEAQFQENLTNSLPGFEGAATGIEVGGLEGSGAQPVSGELTGLHPNATYHLRLFAENGGGTSEAVAASTFTTEAVVAPTVSIEEPITVFSGTTAHLVGHIDPNSPEPAGSQTPAEEAAFEVHWHFVCSPECPGLPTEALPADSSSHEVVSEATGLTPGTAYEVSLVAENAGSPETTANAGPTTFTTEAVAPTISGTTSTGITGTSATLVAQVNPGGVATTWYFDYGTDEGYGHSTPAQTITTELNSADTVEAQVSSLEPGVGYQFRLVASNSAEPGGVDGPDVTFTALEAPATGLPDGRVYEMVSPVGNESADVYNRHAVSQSNLLWGESDQITLLPFQAAADGEAIAYAGDPTVGGNGNSGKGEGNQYLAVRSPGGGWSQSNISLPGDVTAYYQAFSPDLALGVLQDGAAQIPDREPLAPGAPGDGYHVLYSHRFDDSSYRALMTTRPPHRSAEEFKTPGVPKTLTPAEGVLTFAGASADQREFLFEANDALTDASGLTPAAVDPGPEANDLYLSEEGRLSLVNVLPGGGTEAGASFGAAAAGRPEGNTPDFSHDISEDGSRVYWTDLNTGVVYMRENPTAEQSAVSEGECTEEAEACTFAVSAGPARYWTATPDGRFAYYTEEGRLWRFDSRKDSRRALTGPGAGVEAVIGTNEEGEDGSYVYFTATEVLPGSGEDSQGQPPQAGQFNIYVLHGGAAPRFAAGLSTKDVEEALGEAVDRNPRGSFGDGQPGLGNRTASVSTDGTGLVFMSDDQSVDGFSPDFNGNPLEEVYVYSYAADRLVCASCDPGHEQTSEGSLSGRTAGELGEEVGALLPPGVSATYMPHWLSADGSRVFFDSFEPLLPSDTDGTADVYEWERDGAGSCNRAAGCLFLISAGSSRSGSWLIDAGATGKDVFFVTRSELVPGSKSENEIFSLYDARVGGVTPAPPAPCGGSECEAHPSSAPTTSAPGGSTFRGPEEGPGHAKGRVVCPKGKVRKHDRCVKKPAKKHHKKSNTEKGKKQKDKRTAGHKSGGGR